MEAVREAFIRFNACYGTPLQYRSDNGPPFNSKAFEDFMREIGSFHHRNTPLHPEALGELERINSIIDKAYQRAVIEDVKLFREKIINATKAMRCTPHPVLGKAPYDVVFKQKMNIGVVSTVPQIFTKESHDKERKEMETIAERLYLSKVERKKRFDQAKNVKPHEFRVGDRVWVILKLDPKTKKRYEKDLYQITQIHHSQITAVSLETNKVVCRHSNHFKLFIPPYDEYPIGPLENARANGEIEIPRDRADGDDNRAEDDRPPNDPDPDESEDDENEENENGPNGPDDDDDDDQLFHGFEHAPAPGDRNVGARRGRGRGRPPRQQNRNLQFGAQDAIYVYDPNDDNADDVGHQQRQVDNAGDVGQRRLLRSQGPAPNIPNVLPAAPEASAAMRRELNDIHEQHAANRRNVVANQQQNPPQQQQQQPQNPDAQLERININEID